MHRIIGVFLVIIGLAVFRFSTVSGGGGDPAGARGEIQSAFENADELILCGWDEVFVLNLSGPGGPVKVWSWKAVEREELPDSMKSMFETTDECKPADRGRKLIVTSSGGGVALLERETGKVLFYGKADNAHSAELLPGNRLAVAASHKPGGRGDRLIVFDLDVPGKELTSAELPWGHGAVWDEKRQILWALADQDLRAYKLKDWDTDHPALQRVWIIELPEGGGHDLYPVPGTAWLSVSTSRHCWLFDRDKRSFKLHPDLADKRGVKCISVNPSTGQLAWIEAEGENWWAQNVHFLHPEHTLYLPGEHLYKARWNGVVKR
ncbi:MAG TPA: DUF6528 family protein [archaeon]|nr:DUF6528 family protein [archaeon]